MEHDSVPCVCVCNDYKIVNMERIDLKRGDYFKVISKVTGRTVVVTGLEIDKGRILEYHISGEGWWDANRFRKMNNSITADEFYLLEKRVKRLEIILTGLRLYELKKDLEIF